MQRDEERKVWKGKGKNGQIRKAGEGTGKNAGLG